MQSSSNIYNTFRKKTFCFCLTQAVIVSRLKDFLQVLVRVNIYNFIFSVSNIFRMFSKTTNDMWAIMRYCVVYNSTREHKNSILRNQGTSLHPRPLGFPLISCWSLFPCASMIHSLDHNHQAHPPTVLTVAKTTVCILCAVVHIYAQHADSSGATFIVFFGFPCFTTRNNLPHCSRCFEVFPPPVLG